MPTGNLATLPQTGFTNSVTDTDFRLLAFPGGSGHTGQWLQYTGNVISLTSMYLVTTRPITTNALQLHFSLGFTSSLVYPSHYLEIYFQDLDMASIKAPYNQLGGKVPCTLTGFVSAGRANTPRCVINHVDVVHGDLVLRVVEIGALSAGSYRVALDDFLLPDLAALLL